MHTSTITIYNNNNSAIKEKRKAAHHHIYKSNAPPHRLIAWSRNATHTHINFLNVICKVSILCSENSGAQCVGTEPKEKGGMQPHNAIGIEKKMYPINDHDAAHALCQFIIGVAAQSSAQICGKEK